MLLDANPIERSIAQEIHGTHTTNELGRLLQAELIFRLGLMKQRIVRLIHSYDFPQASCSGGLLTGAHTASSDILRGHRPPLQNGLDYFPALRFASANSLSP